MYLLVIKYTRSGPRGGLALSHPKKRRRDDTLGLRHCARYLAKTTVHERNKKQGITDERTEGSRRRCDLNVFSVYTLLGQPTLLFYTHPRDDDDDRGGERLSTLDPTRIKALGQLYE